MNVYFRHKHIAQKHIHTNTHAQKRARAQTDTHTHTERKLYQNSSLNYKLLTDDFNL